MFNNSATIEPFDGFFPCSHDIKVSQSVSLCTRSGSTDLTSLRLHPRMLLLEEQSTKRIHFPKETTPQQAIPNRGSGPNDPEKPTNNSPRPSRPTPLFIASTASFRPSSINVTHPPSSSSILPNQHLPASCPAPASTAETRVFNGQSIEAQHSLPAPAPATCTSTPLNGLKQVSDFPTACLL